MRNGSERWIHKWRAGMKALGSKHDSSQNGAAITSTKPCTAEAQRKAHGASQLHLDVSAIGEAKAPFSFQGRQLVVGSTIVEGSRDVPKHLE